MDLHVNNILNDIKKDDIQAYLLTQFTNVEYLSGYKPTSFAFCIIKENPIIYASGMDMELAVRDSAIEVKKYESYELMINELKEEGIKNLKNFVDTLLVIPNQKLIEVLDKNI